MRAQKTYLALTALATLALTGCGITEPMRKSESNLARLDIGQSKTQVNEVLGKADQVRTVQKLEDGERLELHEYRIYGKNEAIFNALLCPITLTFSCWFTSPKAAVPYWLQYVNGKLEKWGRAGDWSSDQTPYISIRSQP